MKVFLCNDKARQQGSMIYFLVFLLIVCYTTASLGYFVSQTSSITSRRADMISARKYAESGILIACNDLNGALPTNATSSLANNLTSAGYTSGYWGTSASNIYSRTLTATFPGAPVTIQILMTNSPTPQMATISAQSTVGPVSEGQTVLVSISFLGSQGGGGAAIVNVNDGVNDASWTKADGLEGNVAINGGTIGAGALVVSGANAGMAVLANSMVNVSSTATVPPGAVSSTNYGTVNQVPDYTAQGTANSLFDFNQFIAISDNTSNVSYNPTGTDHFTNLQSFINGANSLGPNNAMQGMVVVDVATNDPAINNLTATALRRAGGAINVQGTLFFNFVGAGWSSSNNRLIISSGVNINPANLSQVVSTDPSTYTTGFPPVYADPTKNPTNINVAGLTPSYANILPGQSLPALVYSSGIIDLHGPVNVCGVIYTPNYMELEQMYNTQTQYIRGSIIVGGGIYVENVAQSSTTTISYDPNTLANLATVNNIGQEVEIAYWQ
jgi:hypothetical protein